MIKIYFATQKTNSFTPEPWHWSENPFPAFRGAGQRYNAFMAVAKDYRPWFSSYNLANGAMSDDHCKVITTKKGTKLIVPCSSKEDEHIIFVTARGGFRGGWGRIEVVGGDLIYLSDMRDACMHCCPCAHIVARITDPEGYVITETGRRSSRGEIEIFSWTGGYFSMSAEEYNAALETGSLFATRDTIQDCLATCAKLHAEEAESAKARSSYMDRLEAANAVLTSLNREPFVIGKEYFFRDGRRYLYADANAALAEMTAESATTEKQQGEAYDRWYPAFVKIAKPLDGARSPYGELMPCFYRNMVSMWSVAKDTSVDYDYSQEGLEAFERDLPEYLAEYGLR